jgi:hypothetical protein
MVAAEVYNVPEYGKRWGLSRSGSYRAALTGAWPIVKLGTRLYIPKQPGDALLKTGRSPHLDPVEGGKAAAS